MRKLFFFFSLAFFFLQAAHPQEYLITEKQLLELETICQSYKDNRQMLQKQLQELQNEATTWRTEADELRKESRKLQELLKQERTTTQDLNRSLTQYEISNAQIKQERDQALIQIQKQKVKTRNWTIATITLAVALAALITGFLIMKLG